MSTCPYGHNTWNHDTNRCVACRFGSATCRIPFCEGPLVSKRNSTRGAYGFCINHYKQIKYWMSLSYRERMQAKSRAMQAKMRADPIRRRTIGQRAGKLATDRHKERRQQVFELYGGACLCCGLSDWRFLQLDHINNDGKVERASSSYNGRQVYAKIAKSGVPRADLQPLCCNCNMAKEWYGDCPHKTEIPNAGLQ